MPSVAICFGAAMTGGAGGCAGAGVVVVTGPIGAACTGVAGGVYVSACAAEAATVFGTGTACVAGLGGASGLSATGCGFGGVSSGLGSGCKRISSTTGGTAGTFTTPLDSAHIASNAAPCSATEAAVPGRRSQPPYAAARIDGSIEGSSDAANAAPWPAA